MNDEVSSILQELRHLEIGDSQPSQKRVALLRRLNSAQAATRTLATEILSLIFQHACPHISLDREGRMYNPRGWYSRRFFPLTLGHVSHHWRRVAWSTPQLWTALSLHVHLRAKIKNTIAFLELYLINVSNLPISLDLDLPPTPDSRKSFKAITNVLFRPEYSQKIQFLQVSNAPLGWAHSFSGFSRLGHLSLDGHTQETSSELLLTDVPSLSRISLRNVDSRIILPWASITVLELNSVTIDICTELLSRCLNLVRFRSANLHRPRHAWHGDATTLSTNDKLVYHHLEELTWSHCADSRLLKLFNRIEMPAIRTLSWNQVGVEESEALVDSESFPYIRALFSNLPKSLTSIKFHHLSAWPTSTIQYIFARTHSLREMTLNYCHKDAIRNILKVLNGTSTLYLPYLRTLIINYCYGVYSEASNGAYSMLKRHDEDLVLELLMKRLQRGITSHFRLELLNVNIEWEAPLRYALCDLVGQGFNLELIIDGKRIDLSNKDNIKSGRGKRLIYSPDI